jgi:hypothetical protein
MTFVMVMHPHTKYHWPISKDKNVMAQTRKYYLKNNYLTGHNIFVFRDRSMIFGMWVHDHKAVCPVPKWPSWDLEKTKYNWPISKDKNVMVWTRKYYLKNNYLTLRTKVKVPRRSLRYVIHRLMVMHPYTKYSCTIITFVGPWPLTSMSNNCFLNSIFFSRP